MNNSVKKVLKNIVSMFFANGVSFLVSTIITLVVPKLLSVENYSYFQLYLFYTSYISYLHYGWVDGIRLRYGGVFYDNIDKKLFKSQILLYSIIQIVISLLVIIIILNLGFTGNKFIAIVFVGICMFIRLPRLMPQYILEMSNRIKECSRIIIIEKISYLIIIFILLIFSRITVLSIIIADIIGQILSSIYAFLCCKDIINVKPICFEKSVDEAKENIKSGIKLTIANISSLLIIGIVRQFIEIQWDVETFGKLSLTISISNLLMVFIRAISMVMFPTLRRIDKSKLVDLYYKLRIGIMFPLLGLLIVYSPLKLLISNWLPQYCDSLKYMALLFPMCIFESKMSMLIETYFKTLRLEGILLKINILTLVLSVVFSSIFCFILKNLTLAVFLIVILLAFRCVFAEIILSKKLKINVIKHILMEFLLVSIFILFNWFFNDVLALVIYVLFYIVYLFILKSEIKYVVLYLKEGRKK